MLAGSDEDDENEDGDGDGDFDAYLDGLAKETGGNESEAKIDDDDIDDLDDLLGEEDEDEDI
jgi:hypothetical protein